MDRIERLIERTPILKNEYYKKCLKWASLSQANEVYGSILVKDNKILGEGRNRAVVHGCFKLEREIIQGLSNHAEVEALLDAIKKGYDVEGGDIYTAGYFDDEKRLFLHKEYTCVRCLPHMAKYGIKSIFIPTPEGWVERPFSEAKEEAHNFKNGTHKKRMRSAIKGYKVGDLKELVSYFD
ncbi:MAG: hypothetical protein NUV46_00180 [Nanoarchaeota archaeon]|nr:hypothetical protein [Nanoarchaeota archaeon]